MRPILPIATKGFLAHFRARSSIRVSRVQEQEQDAGIEGERGIEASRGERGRSITVAAGDPWIEAKERGNERKGEGEKGRLDAKEAPTARDREREGVKKGWLPTRLNCIVDAPAHRISMRLFLTIAVLLVGKRKASALLAPRYEESLARLAEAYLVTGRLANRRYRTADLSVRRRRPKHSAFPFLSFPPLSSLLHLSPPLSFLRKRHVGRNISSEFSRNLYLSKDIKNIRQKRENTFVEYLPDFVAKIFSIRSF